jgi:cytoskeletal protein CcmA (bactofilin family)
LKIALICPKLNDLLITQNKIISIMKNLMTITGNSTIKGELRSQGKVKLEGRVEGGGLIDGTLLLSSSAVWIGNIVADIVIVEGTVDGNIVARQKLLLLADAKVTGKLYSSCIHMEEGAKFTGMLEMKSPAPLGLINDLFLTSRKKTNQ